MKNNLNQKRSRRFSSIKSAQSFAKQMGVVVQDLRSNEIRKSDFKVSYTKADAQNFNNDTLDIKKEYFD